MLSFAHFNIFIWIVTDLSMFFLWKEWGRKLSSLQHFKSVVTFGFFPLVLVDGLVVGTKVSWVMASRSQVQLELTPNSFINSSVKTKTHSLFFALNKAYYSHLLPTIKYLAFNSIAECTDYEQSKIVWSSWKFLNMAGIEPRTSQSETNSARH